MRPDKAVNSTCMITGQSMDPGSNIGCDVFLFVSQKSLMTYNFDITKQSGVGQEIGLTS